MPLFTKPSIMVSLWFVFACGSHRIFLNSFIAVQLRNSKWHKCKGYDRRSCGTCSTKHLFCCLNASSANPLLEHTEMWYITKPTLTQKILQSLSQPQIHLAL